MPESKHRRTKLRRRDSTPVYDSSLISSYPIALRVTSISVSHASSGRARCRLVLHGSRRVLMRPDRFRSTFNLYNRLAGRKCFVSTTASEQFRVAESPSFIKCQCCLHSFISICMYRARKCAFEITEVTINYYYRCVLVGAPTVSMRKKLTKLKRASDELSGSHPQ